MIEIKALDDEVFEVTVKAETTTRHKVTVRSDYAESLLGLEYSSEDLVRRSFEFLLEREPNTSILRSFDLQVIERYFPEYRRQIRH